MPGGGGGKKGQGNLRAVRFSCTQERGAQELTWLRSGLTEKKREGTKFTWN